MLIKIGQLYREGRFEAFLDKSHETGLYILLVSGRDRAYHGTLTGCRGAFKAELERFRKEMR